MAADSLPAILWRENDDVVLHSDYVDFSNRTQGPDEKLQNSLSLFFTADVWSPSASLRQNVGRPESGSSPLLPVGDKGFV
jgi:hypothetical protein